MRFLIIVLSLLSEKYLTHQFQRLRKTVLEEYLSLLKKYLPESVMTSHPLSPFGIAISILVAFTILFQSISHHSHGLGHVFNFIFEFCIFYLCLGEHNLFYVNSNQKMILSSDEYIIAMNREVFAPIIWFFTFGSIGVIVYRVADFFSKSSQNPNLLNLMQVLDWVPSRITSILFLMVGQFQPGFSELLKQLTKSPENNETILINSAKHAINLSSKKELNLIDLENLFMHSCILLNFILAVYVIGKIL
jgi:AmpE protein